MHIDKIQAAQPTFGTKVKVDKHTLNKFSRPYGLKKQFKNFINELENNGRDDIFVITRANTLDEIYRCNAFIHEAKPAKEKNGCDLYRESRVLNADLFGYIFDTRYYCKEKIDKLRTLFQYCSVDMSTKDFQPKSINNELAKCTI